MKLIIKKCLNTVFYSYVIGVLNWLHIIFIILQKKNVIDKTDCMYNLNKLEYNELKLFCLQSKYNKFFFMSNTLKAKIILN